MALPLSLGHSVLRLLEKKRKEKSTLPATSLSDTCCRCDSSVDGAGGVDLTTSAEKHTIHVFVEKCLTRLREEDRKLPQVGVRAIMSRV